MGFAELFARPGRFAVEPVQARAITEFAIVDGQQVFGSDAGAGEYSGGMGLPGAWRCSILLSDLLGGVPWHAYRTRSGVEVPERMSPTPSFLEQPAPPDTRITTFSSMALDLIWHGNAIAIIASRNRDGWPTSYLPVPAEYVQVRRAGQGDAYGAVPVGSIIYSVGSGTYAPSDVVHVKGPSRPGALRGMGVLENHLNGTLKLADEQGRQARSLGTSGVPTGVLTVQDTPGDPMDQTEADEVKAGWLRSQRSRTVAVLPSSTTFQALAWNPTETQLLEARQFSLHETALLFGLDPSWLGVSGSSMTYSNIEQQAVNLVRYSLMGHLARFEQTFTLHMPRGTEARANLDALLRADTLTRFQAHALAVTGGWETVDEVRALENRAPLTPAQREAARPAVSAPRPAGQATPIGTLKEAPRV